MNHFAAMTKISRRHAKPLIFLALLPFLANAIALSGLFNTDPTLPFIGLAQDMRGGWVPGPMGWLDPTIAYIVQPQGYLAASDWLHGIIPWWNPYSGVGMPLAAEMQALAFFLPFVFLLHFSAGWLVLRALLQAMCGIFAYALFIELGLARLAALLGGALYALSPIFYLSPHSSMAPLPFLPLLLLGIERAASHRQYALSLIVIAVAYSIYAGFPEVTYFDGLLAGVWALWRITTLKRADWPGFIGLLLLGLVLGTALSLPLLLPFLQYVQLGFLGGHAHGGFSNIHLPERLAVLQILPFLYGIFDTIRPPLDANFGPNCSLVRVPGWISLAVLALGLAAIARPARLPGLRAALFAWAAVWELRYLGFAPATFLLNLFPGIATADSTRFTGPAVNFALYALAALGFDDLQRLGRLPTPRLAAIFAVILGLAAAGVIPLLPFLGQLYSMFPWNAAAAAAGAGFSAFVLVCLAAELRRPRHAALLALLLIAGPLLNFMVPQLAGARAGRIDTAPIHFLQAKIGTSRMMSLGPFDAAFPARYGVASIDYAGMPAPALWTDYLYSYLFGNGDLNIYRGGALGEQATLMDELPHYEQIGVRYVVTNPGSPLIQAPTYTPLNPGTRNYPQMLMPGGPDLTGIMAAHLPFPTVTGISALVGTYGGMATGPVIATLCANKNCAFATADAATAGDNVPLTFLFNTPLNVPPGAGFAYRFSHPSGRPIAFWLVPDSWGHEQPSITFISVTNGPAPSLVFQDDIAAIYELPDPAPYAQTSDPACAVTIYSRQKLRTLCPAATTLLRREMFYPGWAATVNGAPVAVSQAGLFQSIPLPAGAAQVRFSYAPPHIRLACALALLALAIWIGSGRFSVEKLRKRLLSPLVSRPGG